MMNTEDYQSLQQMSSTFSGLVFSALAQNAAIYAAASFASTMWPWLNLGGAPVEPSANSSGIPQPRPMNPTSSMAAIAGATVAAATAWWAANGMFPLGPQYHAGFACSPPSAAAAQTAGSQSGNVNGEARESVADPALQCQQPDGKLFNALHSTSKSPTSSSSDSEASEAEKLNGRLNPSGTAEAEKSSGSNVSINEKQMDRFSSGSNSLSSSEVEPDATKMNEENHMETMEDTEQPNGVPSPAIDLSSRRSRSNNSLNDPWKEVSQEGRLAFQALFSREVLPQSFPPSHVLTNKLKKHCSGCREDGDGASIFKPDEEKGSSFNIGKNHEGPLNQELGHTKAKDYRAGFRLYKRCSMEAKEIPEEHKDSKKLRL